MMKDPAAILLPLRVLREVLLERTNQSDDPWLSDRWEKAAKSLQIITKNQGRRPLIYNDAQEELWEIITTARRKKEPTRIIVLKYRRKGISTFVQAIFFLDCLLRPDRYSYMASFEDESTQKIFRISHTFWDHLPSEFKKDRRLRARRKLELAFEAPHNSTFTAGTANRQFLASGQLIHNLHLSEPAKYKDPPAHDAITSVLQCVPRHWDTCVIWESTAAGVGLFKDWWDDARSKDLSSWNGYTPVFRSWKGDPECRVPVPAGAENIFSQEDRAFQEEAGITDEELYWAKLVRREQCHNDQSEFLQEYPWCPEVAFRIKGDQWIEPVVLKQMENNICPPKYQGDLAWASKDYPVVDFVQDARGHIEIWEKPKKGREYIIAADIAEGCAANYTVAHVFNIPKSASDTPRQVAKLRSNRIDAAQAGEILYMMGVYYNWAYLCPEVNNQGLLTCSVLRDGTRCPQMHGGYPAIHYHILQGRKDEPETRKLGWLTTSQTKHLMLGDLKQALRAGEIVVTSAATFRELEGFSFDPTRNDWFQQYRNPDTGLRHTDEVIALAISIQALRHRRDAAAPGKQMEE